jgi:hypothetical protein
MPQTIAFLESVPFLSSISICDRDNLALFVNSREQNGKWTYPNASASEVIIKFRDTPLSKEQKSALLESWNALSLKKKNRKAPEDEIETVLKMINASRLSTDDDSDRRGHQLGSGPKLT